MSSKPIPVKRLLLILFPTSMLSVTPACFHVCYITNQARYVAPCSLRDTEQSLERLATLAKRSKGRNEHGATSRAWLVIEYT